jgi:hypothetical protein
MPSYAIHTLLPQVVWGIMIEGRAHLYEAAEFRFACKNEIINWNNRPYVVAHNRHPFYQSLIAARDVSREMDDARASGRYWLGGAR